MLLISLPLPSIDSTWDSISLLEQDRRSSTAGVMASCAIKAKLAHKGNPPDNRTIFSQCHQQNIHYWLIALEKDGCSSSSFGAFFKKVYDAAGKFSGQKYSRLSQLLARSFGLSVSPLSGSAFYSASVGLTTKALAFSYRRYDYRQYHMKN